MRKHSVAKVTKVNARGTAAGSCATKGAKVRRPQKSMREILDERARIYSRFCKARR
jgi:hypothetical protein